MKQLMLVQAVAAFVLAAATLHAQKLHRFPVTGAVTDSSATVAVWLDHPGTFTLRYGLDSALSDATLTGIVTVNDGNENVGEVMLGALRPSTRYYYRVADTNGVPVSPAWSFKTFPRTGEDAPVSLLFGSCQQEHPGQPGRVFDVAAGLGGDLFVQLGDWSYPDERVPEYPYAPGTIREAYELRLDTMYEFSTRVLSRMGLAYIWDDHDYAGDNCDGTLAPEIKQELLEAYHRYLPHYPLANPSNGIWHSFRIGNAEVFMIDSRSQRTPVDSAFMGYEFAPPAGHSMLAGFPISGVDQRQWLMDAIRRSTARWKILVSPVFFNPSGKLGIDVALAAGHKKYALEFADKWIGYPADIDSMLRLIDQGYGENMIVISGDAHTNLYDNGSHSRIPEFMVGNLEIENSNLYTLLRRFDINIWTDGQTNDASTIGRIRIETTPVHKLIVESFDEYGKLLLSYEITDTERIPTAMVDTVKYER